MSDPSNSDSGAAITGRETGGQSQKDKTIQTGDKVERDVDPETPKFQRNASLIAGESFQQIGEATGEFTTEELAARKEISTGRSAFFVAAGILISRVAGLVRQRVFAHYFGTSAAGDAFTAAFRIPNFLQNVFGEGALSASFIPVYAKLLAQEDEEEASQVASAVLSLLALVTSLIVLIGVFTAPSL